MTKVLILGATGNLGGLAAEALESAYPAVSLRLASSREAGRARLRERHPRAEIVAADWYDEASLVGAVKGVDRIFIVTPDFVTDEHVVTPNIIRAVKAAGGVSLVVRLIAFPPGLTAADLSPAVLATQCGAAMHLVAKPLLDASGLPIAYVNVPCWIMFNLPWFMAGEVKMHRRLAMPASSDAPRLWISEADVGAIAAKILAEGAAKHAGKEYVITGTERYDYRQLAKLLSEELGEKVTYVDTDEQLRATMGENFSKLTTYFTHETRDYRNVAVTDTVLRMLGHPPITLREYIHANKNLFL